MRQTSQESFNKRTKILLICLCLVGLVFIGQLYNLQIIQGDEFREKAERQYLGGTADFDRGVIFFNTREGQPVPVASTKNGAKISIVPGLVTEPNKLYEKLSNHIPNIDKDKFINQANKKDDPYEEVASRLPAETTDQMSGLEKDGVRFHRDSWRFYPHQNMASQVIGFVAYRDNDLVGQYGLERQYEEVLKRKNDTNQNLFTGILTSISRTLSPKWFNEGDLLTTLELASQRELIKVLNEIHTEWQSETTGGIIIDPKSGAVIAMDSVPNFDPNNRLQTDTPFFRNPITENLYEMGSIMKPLIVAGAIDSKAIGLDFNYNDTGSIVVQNRTIFNFDKKGRGENTNLITILSDSLNTGMVKIEQAMGHSTTKKYLEQLDLRKKSGIDLPNDSIGITSNLDTLGDVEYANISFGQGIAVTPITMTKALSTLANYGKLPKPYIGDKIIFPAGSEQSLAPDIEKHKRVFSAEAVKQVTDILVDSVDNTLGNGRYKNEFYRIAAKTGTAQIPNPAGGYYDDRNLHTFFGYFPASDPKYLVFLYTKHPKGARFSSQTLAKPFFDLTNFLINYYRIPPDR